MYLEQSQYLDSLKLFNPQSDDLISPKKNNQYGDFIRQFGFKDSNQSDIHYLRMAKGAFDASDLPNCQIFISKINAQCEKSVRERVQ